MELIAKLEGRSTLQKGATIKTDFDKNGYIYRQYFESAHAQLFLEADAMCFYA
jgi:hypothetical protein